MTIRDTIVNIAQNFSGVGAGNSPDRYLDLLGPNESEVMRASLLTMFSCALVVRGIWRKAGLRDSRLSPPYTPGMAMANVIDIARDRGALAHPRLPLIGDFVYVVSDSGSEHVYTVTDICKRHDGSIMITSVDGGQRDRWGKQCIATCLRTWETNPTMTWDIVHHATGDKRRRVVNIIDTDELGFPAGHEDVTTPGFTA